MPAAGPPTIEQAAPAAIWTIEPMIGKVRRKLPRLARMPRPPHPKKQ